MDAFKKSWHWYLLITLCVILGVTTLGYAVVNHLYGRFVTDRVEIDHNIIASENGENDVKIPKAFEDNTLNILLMATDESGLRTDSMMVIHYDQTTKTTSLFSIPRDYRVGVSEELKTLIDYHRDYIKFTEFHSYAKIANYESPASLTAQAVEELLNMELDHMVLINIDGFKQLIDSVDGVEVNVPMNMDYDDPTQNLHIHLKAGLQVVDGDKAEQLVRFRQTNNHKGYGDFGRMEMQQYVLTAYVKKLFSVSSLLNVAEIYSSLADFVTTDATLEDAIGILKIVKDADLKRISSHTLPGTPETIDGVSFFTPPEPFELLTFVKDTIKLDKLPLSDSKALPLIILNGTSKKGLAEEYAAMLTAEGYTISETGTYKGNHTNRTKIYVPREGLGNDVKAYFELSEIIVDPTQFKADQPESIIIALGSLQK